MIHRAWNLAHISTRCYFQRWEQVRMSISLPSSSFPSLRHMYYVLDVACSRVELAKRILVQLLWKPHTETPGVAWFSAVVYNICILYCAESFSFGAPRNKGCHSYKVASDHFTGYSLTVLGTFSWMFRVLFSTDILLPGRSRISVPSSCLPLMRWCKEMQYHTRKHPSRIVYLLVFQAFCRCICTALRRSCCKRS